MDTKTVYVPVPITERLPTSDVILDNGFPIFLNFSMETNLFFGYCPENNLPVFWLEKQEMVVITKTEFEARIADAFNTGYEEFKYNMYKDK